MEEEEEEVKEILRTLSLSTVPFHSPSLSLGLYHTREQAAGRSPTKPHTDDQYEY